MNIVLAINWVSYPQGSGEERRQDIAKQSLVFIKDAVEIIAIGAKKDLEAMPFFVRHTIQLKRDARTTLNYKKAVPYIKDILRACYEANSDPEGFIMYANADIIFLPTTVQRLKSLINKGYSTIAISKEDIKGNATMDLSRALIKQGNKDNNGQDIFVIQRKVWPIIDRLLPDYLLGEMAWDNHLQLICDRYTKHYNAETPPFLVKHIKHSKGWKEDTIGKRYNRKLWEDTIHRAHTA